MSDETKEMTFPSVGETYLEAEVRALAQINDRMAVLLLEEDAFTRGEEKVYLRVTTYDGLKKDTVDRGSVFVVSEDRDERDRAWREFNERIERSEGVYVSGSE